MRRKIGIDIHGVIDQNPDLFAAFTWALFSSGWEVHIITGQRKSEALKNLKLWGTHYTHFFSITDYHEEKKTEMVYGPENNPWMDSETWNKAKARYCKENGIDLHIDDSSVYGDFFETPYLRAFMKKVSE